MKKALILSFALIISLCAAAQSTAQEKDSTTFKGYLYNEKYNVYIVLDFTTTM